MILVKLTDYGRGLIETSQREKEHFAKELLTDISDTELTVLRKILVQLNTNIEKMKGNA